MQLIISDLEWLILFGWNLQIYKFANFAYKDTSWQNLSLTINKNKIIGIYFSTYMMFCVEWC